MSETVRARHEKKNRISGAVVAYLEGLELVGGDHDGQPFEVLPWESRFIGGAFGQPGDAALSIARGNGKSAVVAGIACAVVDPAGPLHGRRREVVCVASTFEQSRVVYEDALAMLGERYNLHARTEWRLQDSVNKATLEHKASGSRIRCIGSDPKGAHGLRPALVLADEPAQWDRAKAAKMLAALRTSLGKVPGSRFIALGTRPSDAAHWFARMLDSTHGYGQVHAARPDDPPFALRTIRAANPSYDHLPSLRAQLATEAEAARDNPELLASWNALRLNLGTADTDERVILERGAWRTGREAEREGLPVIGIDLGGTAAMSASAAVWETGRMELFAAFPTEPSIEKRATRDGAAYYAHLVERGELIQLGRATVPVDEFLQAVLDRFGVPECIVADRWREGELRDAMHACSVIAPLELRGQGFKDGGEDLRAFRTAMLDGHVEVAGTDPDGGSPLFRVAVLESRAVCDPAGNEKLAKSTEGGRRRRARDDATAAAIVAVAEWWRRRQAPPQGLFVAGATDEQSYETEGYYQ